MIVKRGRGYSSAAVINRLLQQPALAAAVQALPSESLAKVVEGVGLEDAGQILSLANTDQLLGILDTDLWIRTGTEEGEKFDADRFTIWLEVLLEAGEKKLAGRLVELPPDLLYLAIFEKVFVLNLNDLAQMQLSHGVLDVNLVDKALESCLGHELEEYFVVARQHEGWDTLLATLMALSEYEPDFLDRLLSRCCHASTEYIEESGGLHQALTCGEMLEVDAGAERSDRRSAKGYVAHNDAVAFLKLAAITEPEEVLAGDSEDHLTMSYFRELESESKNAGSGVREDEDGALSRKLLDSLSDEEVVDATVADTLRLPGGSQCSATYRDLIASLAVEDPEGNSGRAKYIVYLANVIEARFGTREDPVRPADALHLALEICNVGLQYQKERREGDDCDYLMKLVRERSPEKLFMIGWSSLFPVGAPGCLGDVSERLELNG